jgi:antitoxin (DNA-binding transcriptional repressor) of toxin-antitoxin stability system
MIEVMEQIHMTEAEVTRDFAAVLERVRQGVEVVVEQDHQAVAVLRPAAPPRRTISECIALAERFEKERGYAVTLDPDFAADVEEFIRNRQPWNPPTWD